VNQRGGLLHVLLPLVLLVLDDPLLDGATTPAPAATAALILRMCGGLLHRRLLHLAVRTVVAAIQLAALLFTLQLDDRGLDPLVFRELLRGLPQSTA
jgi:hypothetical protein